MKILHLIAGAGPMYCGSCMHGNTLASALRKAGGDVIVAPVYTPLRTDEDNISIDRLALGGINVYLQESSSLFRWMPSFVHEILDRPSLVRWAAKRGSRTRPEHLGSLTLSMLRGEDGPLRGELEKLVAWLDADVHPDVIHFSNVMLAGLARRLHERTGARIVCTLSGEDSFLEKLAPSHYEQARAVLRERAADLTALVAMNRYYADFMADYLAYPRERIHVIAPGLNLDGYPKPATGPIAASTSGPAKTIGFFGRVCSDKGLHVLAEAAAILAADRTLPPFRIRAAGYFDEAERPYLDSVRARLERDGLADRFEFVGELDRSGKIAFFESLDVISLPSTYPESKGLPVLEAWACGVPAVLPAHGAFPEMLEDTGGGLLHRPCDAPSLAAALGRMLREDGLAAESGMRAHAAVHDRYHSEREAVETLALYERLCSIS